MENIEEEFKKSSRSDKQKLDKICVTRWVIRTKCFKRFLDNYEASLELWKQSSKKNLNFDTKSRIGGFKNQMKLFKSHFGLNLKQHLHTIMGTLSKTSQLKKMSAHRGTELADLTVQTLENLRNEHDFSLLYKTFQASASEIEAILPPNNSITLQRKPA